MAEISLSDPDLAYKIRRAREKGAGEMLIKLGAPALAAILMFNSSENVNAESEEVNNAVLEAINDTAMRNRLNTRSMTVDISDNTKEQTLETYLRSFSASYYDAIKRKPTLEYAIENYNLQTGNLGPAVINTDMAKLMLLTDWKNASRSDFETALAIFGPESGGTVDEGGNVWYHLYAVGDINRDGKKQFSICPAQINARPEYASDPYRNPEKLLDILYCLQAAHVIKERQGFRAAWHTTVVNKLHLKPAFMESSLQATQDLVDHGYEFAR